MELVRLNAQNQEEKLIEGYDSLIWAERFGPTGDFQLVTGQIEKFMKLLPEGKHVSLRDSPVPMIVETHDIKTPKNGLETLTITGRSFESVLDRRVWITFDGDPMLAQNPVALVNGLIENVCNIGYLGVADVFPSAEFQYIGIPGGPPAALRSFDAVNGNLLNICQDLLGMYYPQDAAAVPPRPRQEPHSFGSRRPVDGSETACYIQPYSGTDRRYQVSFSADMSLLNDGRYLFSKIGSANAALGVAEDMYFRMYEGVAEPTGFNRRVILVDANDSAVAQPEQLRMHMSMTLAEAKEIAMFDGTINPDISEYKYGVDYNLGDIVTINGRYGLTELARVTEYIRVKDAAGMRSYPTLSTHEDF